MTRRAPPPPPLPAWDEAPIYTIAKGAFAADLAVTPACVSQWCARGLPVRPDGLLDLAAGAQWLIDNLDPTNGHRTRREAWDLRRYIVAQTTERFAARLAVEHAGAVAHEAAHRLGLGNHAEALADNVAVGMVERMNEGLETDCNIALPPPPPGVWRAKVEEDVL